jgi:hypothetical protein
VSLAVAMRRETAYDVWAMRITITLLLAVASAFGANVTASLKAGKADLKSAGPLAFGPEGILFVADPMGARVFAIATGDTKAAKAADIALAGLGDKVAALLGTSADQLLVNDMAVNPLSKNVYLSVSRGKGPDAAAVVVKVTRDGKVSEVDLGNVAHSSVTLQNVAAPEAKDRRGAPLRAESITDLEYVDGKVLVAGLSNEEFASTLRSFPFPFAEKMSSTNVEIYHGAHGRFETNAPIRTFTSYQIQNKPHILAAYTCTPLVTIPMTSLEPGKKVMGTTIAELGNRNRPLDMVVYKKGAANFVLMNNSSRGVMKIPADGLENYKTIDKPVADKQGVPYETLSELKGVEQLARLDEGRAVMLIKAEGGAMELKTLALP